MRHDERSERAETPARLRPQADSLDRDPALYRALSRDLDTMGQAKVGTRGHRDRVRQLAIVVRSLARRGLIN